MTRPAGIHALTPTVSLHVFEASERVDLFVIDAQNRFILVIENKAGAAHGERLAFPLHFAGGSSRR